MPTVVTFQVQTPRTFASLSAQEAMLLSVPIPLEALSEKIGVGAPTMKTAAKTAANQVTLTVSCPLLPIFFQAFPPGSDPLPTLGNLLTGVVETNAHLRFVTGSAVLS